VGNTATWSRFFNSNFSTQPWINPADSFDVQTGIYTVTQEGVYSVQVLFSVNAFATPANKTYEAGIRLTIIPLTGPNIIVYSYNGGEDNVPVSVTMLAARPLQKGVQFYFDVTAVHDQQTGTTPARGSLVVSRLSGLGNNTA